MAEVVLSCLVEGGEMRRTEFDLVGFPLVAEDD
jgi:hypothetical protein